jgi:hypothetical protein
MNNVNVTKKDGSVEYFEGVVAFNAGNTAVQLSTYDGRSTVLVLEVAEIARIDLDPIDDNDLSGQSEEFQAWYAKQLKLAEDNAALSKKPEPVGTIQ